MLIFFDDELATFRIKNYKETEFLPQFLSPIPLEPIVPNIWYFKLRPICRTEFIAWKSTVYGIGFQRNRDQKIRVCGKNLLCKIVFAFFDYFANIACVEIKTLVLPIKIFNLENYIKFSPNIMMYILYILCIGKCIFAKSLLYFSLLKEVQFWCTTSFNTATAVSISSEHFHREQHNIKYK